MQLSWELKRKRLFPSQIKWNLKFANSLSPKCTVQFACYQEASFVLKATLRNYNPLQIFDTIRYTICILYSFYSVLLAKAPLVEALSCFTDTYYLLRELSLAVKILSFQGCPSNDSRSIQNQWVSLLWVTFYEHHNKFYSFYRRWWNDSFRNLNHLTI